MLNVGIIGYGGRVSSMAKALGMYNLPYRVAAIADPRAQEIHAAGDPFLADTAFYTDAEAMLGAGGLDGVMVARPPTTWITFTTCWTSVLPSWQR